MCLSRLLAVGLFPQRRDVLIVTCISPCLSNEGMGQRAYVRKLRHEAAVFDLESCTLDCI